MLIKTLTRRVAPAAAVFAVLGGALVAQDRIATDDLSVEPAILTEHALQTRTDGPIEKRLSPDHHDDVAAAEDADDLADVEHLEQGHLVAELPRTDMKGFSLLGVTWTEGLTDDEAGTLVEVQTRSDDGTWSDWEALHIEPGQTGRPGTEPLWVGDSDGVAVRVLSAGNDKVSGLSLATIDPGETPEVTPVAASNGQPPIIMRSSWGAQSNTSCDEPRYGDATLGAVIHHTVGKNSYTKAESPGIVKGIQTYHMGSRNWCDIGYNFLVDKYGQIFEGRSGGIDKTVRGAHAGNGPVNQETVGVSLMGTFTTANPTAEMKNSVADLVAWRFSLEGVPAKGTYKLGGLTLNRISGHRNVVSTECPGARVYSWLGASGGLRDMVETRLENAYPMPIPRGLTATPTNTSLSLDWDDVSGAQLYRVQLSTAASMSGATYHRFASSEGTIAGLEPGMTYYYRVAVIDPDTGEKLSDYTQSPYPSVKTYVHPIPGNLESTAQTPSSVSLSWSAVSGAPHYRVQYSTNASMSGAKYADTTGTSLTLSGLATGTTYYVRVAVVEAGNGGKLSDYTQTPYPSVKTSAAYPGGYDLPVPSGLKSTAQTPSSLSLDWDDVAGAQMYRVQLSTASSMAGATYHTFTASNGTISGLKASTTYYFRVAAVDPATGAKASDYTQTPYPSVKTSAAYPGGFAYPIPGNLESTAQTPSSVSLSWSAVSGAPHYRVQYSTNASMSGAKYADTTGTSLTLSGLATGTTYYVRVAVVEAGNGGKLSDYTQTPYPSVHTTIPGGYQLPIPTGLAVTGQTASGLSLDWADVSGADLYRVQLSTVSSMSGATYHRFSASNGTISGLKAGTTYYFRVAVIDPVSGGKLSDYTQNPYPSAQTTGSSAKNSVTVPSSRTISIKGHGYGHGNGMSQYGAEGGAREGKTYSQILAHYYPGTALGSKSGDIRVLLSADTTNSVMVEAASGITFRQGSTSFTLPTTIGGKKVIRWSIDPVSSDKKKSTLRYRTSSVWQVYQNRTWTGNAQFEATTLRLVMPDDSNRTYRDTLRSAVPKSGATYRDTVNVLSIEDYTRGVVAREMPSSWHAEALKAQAVAARTYGVRGLNPSKYYDMCDTTSCQVYGGVAAETAATDAAVSGTKGKILTYSGSPAFTQFSSSSGGYTNKGSQPYLKPIADPWDGWSGNKNHAWTISVKASTIEKEYSSIGTLKSLSITKRNGYGDMGGRVTSVTLTGSKGSKTISGVDARWAFGLKSDWFGF